MNKGKKKVRKKSRTRKRVNLNTQITHQSNLVRQLKKNRAPQRDIIAAVNVLKKLKARLVEIIVLVYNINYWDKDGKKIVENNFEDHQLFDSEYKYDIGESGAYGTCSTYIIPKTKIKDFRKAIKQFYRDLKIKNLKIKVVKTLSTPEFLLIDKKPE
jgi:hypothetical protein